MSSKTIKSLLSKIEDRDERAVAAAKPVLADAAMAKALVAHLEKGGDLPEIATEVLWHHRDRPALAEWAALAGAVDDEARPYVMAAVAALARSAAEAAVLAGIAELQGAYIDLAGDAGITAAIPALRAKVDELYATLRAKGTGLKMGPDALAMEIEALPRAIVALGKLGVRDHLDKLPPLARLVGTDDEFAEPTRAVAARGLCVFTVPGMVPVLEEALKKEPETEVAVAIIDALALVGTAPVIDFLLKRAKSQPDVAADRLNERLNELIGGEETDDTAVLAKRWAKLQPAPGVTYRRGRPFEMATLAADLTRIERAPSVITDAVALTGDRFDCLRPDLAARFLDLAPRVLAWASAHPHPPGVLLELGQPVDPATLG